MVYNNHSSFYRWASTCQEVRLAIWVLCCLSPCQCVPRAGFLHFPQRCMLLPSLLATAATRVPPPIPTRCSGFFALASCSSPNLATALLAKIPIQHLSAKFQNGVLNIPPCEEEQRNVWGWFHLQSNFGKSVCKLWQGLPLTGFFTRTHRQQRVYSCYACTSVSNFGNALETTGRYLKVCLAPIFLLFLPAPCEPRHPWHRCQHGLKD